MPGHIPDLNAESLVRLRQLVNAMQSDNGKGVPFANLVALNQELQFEAGLTIDFDATVEFGSPMVVLRVPTAPVNKARLGNLTKREDEVASLIATGLTNAGIADRLSISLPTVKDHVHSILKKNSLKSRTQIAAAVLA